MKKRSQHLHEISRIIPARIFIKPTFGMYYGLSYFAVNHITVIFNRANNTVEVAYFDDQSACNSSIHLVPKNGHELLQLLKSTCDYSVLFPSIKKEFRSLLSQSSKDKKDE